MKSTQPQQVAGGTKTIGGIAANSLMRPIIIVLALLHVAIIGLIMQINATSAELSETMKTAGQQIEEATSVLRRQPVVGNIDQFYTDAGDGTRRNQC